MPIRSFKDRRTRAAFEGGAPRGVPLIVLQRLQTKLQILHAAPTLESLMIVPGNRFEALGGDRRGQYSIRVNVQWRLCFRWIDGGAEDVEFVDYH